MNSETDDRVQGPKKKNTNQKGSTKRNLARKPAHMSWSITSIGLGMVMAPVRMPCALKMLGVDPTTISSTLRPQCVSSFYVEGNLEKKLTLRKFRGMNPWHQQWKWSLLGNSELKKDQLWAEQKHFSKWHPPATNHGNGKRSLNKDMFSGLLC